ncbi:alpha/beta hydrolase [Paenibacillus lutrae]|uniref:Alpha/beta fold hydrolase n=1 Tax=Paenibacillus lutrae TaxID=2078573 RepID=A0A7X3FGN0_9BACL|nr:alpha/beta fold hydrolase [Paenibacillus lutrae]MVO99305.1 alpha/beta fold hydrolase [Paenibacillus lutrae]
MSWVLWSVAALISFVIVGSIGISAYVGWQLTHPRRQPVDDSPQTYGLTYEDVEFVSRKDSMKLSGWLISPEENGGDQAVMTIIFAHGYAGNRLERGLPALALANTLVRSGYRVLLFDFRNSGRSSGTLTSVGYYEKQDLLGAIDWMSDKFPAEPIGLIGFSMGATTSLLAAAEHQNVAAVIADSPFHHLKKYLKTNLPVWSGLPNFPFTPLILSLFPPLLKIDPEGVDATSAVEAIYPRPVLFIHSRDDAAIPQNSSEQLWERHQDRFEFWPTVGAPHVGSYQMQPEEYAGRILAFFGSVHTMDKTLEPAARLFL